MCSKGCLSLFLCIGFSGGLVKVFSPNKIESQIFKGCATKLRDNMIFLDNKYGPLYLTDIKHT